MNRMETTKIITVMAGTYPKYYMAMDKDSISMLIDVWSSIFSEDAYTVVNAALKTYISSDTSGFPPVPGQIKEIIINITGCDEMSEGEAWSMVRKAISNSNYHAREEFDKLPPLVQKVVANPQILSNWAMAGSDAVGTVIYSNFIKSYRAAVQKSREEMKRPADVTRIMEQQRKQIEDVKNAPLAGTR